MRNGCLPHDNALSLSLVNSIINMELELWTLMNLSGILCDVE